VVTVHALESEGNSRRDAEHAEKTLKTEKGRKKEKKDKDGIIALRCQKPSAWRSY